MAVEQVAYSLATIKRRILALPEVIKRVLPQCDVLQVYLNDHDSIPVCLSNPKIIPIFGKGDLGDTGKFYDVDKYSGYHFTIDDDILYPPDYTERMIAAIEKYSRKAVIGVHGSILNNLLKRDYYYARKVFPFKEACSERNVHIIGTGTMAYHSSTIRVQLSDFKIKNMTDVWFALLGQKQQIPFIIIPRGKRWLNNAPNIRRKDSICDMSRGHTHGMTQMKICRTIPNWRIYKLS